MAREGRVPLPSPSSSLVLEVVRVDLGEFGVHRAGLDAGIAVDALVGVDVELLDVVVIGLVRRRVDAVDGTDLDARVVLLSYAGLGDDVGHSRSSPSSYFRVPAGSPGQARAHILGMMRTCCC